MAHRAVAAERLVRDATRRKPRTSRDHHCHRRPSPSWAGLRARGRRRGHGAGPARRGRSSTGPPTSGRLAGAAWAANRHHRLPGNPRVGRSAGTTECNADPMGAARCRRGASAHRSALRRADAPARTQLCRPNAGASPCTAPHRSGRHHRHRLRIASVLSRTHARLRGCVLVPHDSGCGGPARAAPGAIGVGEPLPGGVAREWARWGRADDWLLSCVEDAPRCYADFDRPVLALRATDDEIAPEPAEAAWIRTLSGAEVTTRTWAPSAIGVPNLGHFGLLRPAAAETVWPGILAHFRAALSRNTERNIVPSAVTPA